MSRFITLQCKSGDVFRVNTDYIEIYYKAKSVIGTDVIIAGESYCVVQTPEEIDSLIDGKPEKIWLTKHEAIAKGVHLKSHIRRVVEPCTPGTCEPNYFDMICEADNLASPDLSLINSGADYFAALPPVLKP